MIERLSEGRLSLNRCRKQAKPQRALSKLSTTDAVVFTLDISSKASNSLASHSFRQYPELLSDMMSKNSGMYSRYIGYSSDGVIRFNKSTSVPAVTGMHDACYSQYGSYAQVEAEFVVLRHQSRSKIVTSFISLNKARVMYRLRVNARMANQSILPHKLTTWMTTLHVIEFTLTIRKRYVSDIHAMFADR